MGLRKREARRRKELKKHIPTTAEIIRARAALAGMTPEQVRARAGLSKATWYRRMNQGGWLLAEIAAIDSLVHFTGEDILKRT